MIKAEDNRPRVYRQYFGLPGVVMAMRDGAEYTRTENGQIVRVDRDHRTKKERNRDRRLRTATGL